MKSICIHNGTVISAYASIENCSLLIEEGSVKELITQDRFEKKHFDAETIIMDVEGAFIAPGFIDTHIHGYGGFGTDDAIYPEYKIKSESSDSTLEMSRLLLKNGVTAFNPTLYPAPEDLMIKAAAMIVSVMGKEDGARIMGLHLEGPFLSSVKIGVQRPETISSVNLDFMEKLFTASQGHIVNMTVAPEIENISELALYCARKGIVLQAGHTNADFEEMKKGMQAGILHATHMFNAMSKLDQRNPGAVGAILTHPEVSCEIIADGIHVHPSLIKLLSGLKPIEKIVLVTDSLKCTDQAEGPFFANGEEMIFSGGVYRRGKDDVIAGSALNMMRGVQNLVKFGFTPEEAVRAASSSPAAVMRYSKKGKLLPGMDADITVFDRDFTVRAVIVGGEIRYKNF